MKKHILVISQYFYPEQFRINDICCEWINRGYKVTVVTGIPNYPQGKFYLGYGLFKKRKEVWNGIEIIRLPIISRGHSSVRLALNYLSFVISGWFWAHFTRERPDTVFIYEVSPMTQGLLGVWLAKRRKIPCHIYVTDLWPENFEIITGIHNRLIVGPLEKMVMRIYNGCKTIFTSSQSFIDAIAKRGVSRDKIVFWPQYAEEFYAPVARDALAEGELQVPQDGKCNILFAGNIGEAQGLSVLAEAASLLKQGDFHKLRFVLVGDGRYKATLQALVREQQLEEYFLFFEKVPATQVPLWFAQVSASLICLSKNEVFAMTLPAKTQSCLACGKPVVVCADGEVRDVVQEARCGISAAAADSEGLCDALIQLASKTPEEMIQMGDNARKFFVRNYEKQMLLDKMDGYLNLIKEEERHV